VAGTLLVVFLVVGAEATYGYWIFSYSVEELHFSDQFAAFINSAFWGAFTAGRILGVLAAAALGPTMLMMVILLLSTRGSALPLVVPIAGRASGSSWPLERGGLWQQHGLRQRGQHAGDVCAGDRHDQRHASYSGGRLEHDRGAPGLVAILANYKRAWGSSLWCGGRADHGVGGQAAQGAAQLEQQTDELADPTLSEEGQAPRPGGDQSRTRCRARGSSAGRVLTCIDPCTHVQLPFQTPGFAAARVSRPFSAPTVLRCHRDRRRRSDIAAENGLPWNRNCNAP
jgi:hypothetical protein